MASSISSRHARRSSSDPIANATARQYHRRWGLNAVVPDPARGRDSAYGGIIEMDLTMPEWSPSNPRMNSPVLSMYAHS